MSQRTDRFAKRRQEKAERKRKEHVREVADQADIAALLTAPADVHTDIMKGVTAEWSLEVDPQAVRRDAVAMLAVVRKDFDAARTAEVMQAARRSVIDSIVGPFGVGYLVARLDKNGGPVTTVHNADRRIFADMDSSGYSKEQNNYDRSYKRCEYTKDILPADYPDRNVSGYTGKMMTQRDDPELEHVVSLHSYHADKLLRLATTLDERREMANQSDNLAFVEGRINSSKSKESFEDWSCKIRADGQRNDVAFGIDAPIAHATVTKANRAKMRQKTVAVVRHFGGEVVLTSVATGARLGTQQAIGLLMSELADGIFDEFQDVLAHGFKGGAFEVSFLKAMGVRLGRVSKRLLLRWKDVLRAFGNGALAGMLSTVVTVVINTFLTTARNVVRVIREGAASLWKAVKLLISPPLGMTLQEAAHEAMKIILTGAIVIGGVALEEVIAKMLGGLPLATQLTTVLVGIVSGLAMTFGAWLVDKLDLLGVVAAIKDADAVERLGLHSITAQNAINKNINEIEFLFTNLVKL